MEAHTCDACANEPLAVEACLSAVTYGFPWDACIAQFKFKGDASLGRCLAHVMLHAPHVEPALEAADHVIAMPLSAPRLRERGFNQAYVLAKQLAPSKASAHVLQRAGDGAHHQVGATREERLNFAQDVFWVAPQHLAALQQTRVVLVDDVMTTGATLSAAATVLKRAGVAHVTGLVFARAQRR